MAQLGERTGRPMHIVEYAGHPEAERVVVVMGSGAETVRRDRRRAQRARRAGRRAAGAAVPAVPGPGAARRAARRRVRRIAVLDRTKEPGSIGEPLFLDVVAALTEAHADGERAVMPRVIGGRYGLSSKEFTPGMVAGVFAELAPRAPAAAVHRSASTTTSPARASPTTRRWTSSRPTRVRAVFFGLGSDGTVGANKNTIKILGAEEDLHAQGYFVYDSKKSGSQTVSHLRFGPRPIRAPYLVEQASFVGCHQFGLLEQVDVLGRAAPGATLLLNCRHPPDEVWDALPRPVQEQILAKDIERLRDRRRPDRPRGRPGRPDQHRPADLLLRDLRRAAARARPSTGSRRRSPRPTASAAPRWWRATMRRSTATLEGLQRDRAARGGDGHPRAARRMVPAHAPEFVRTVTAEMMAGRGDALPVSALPVDGTYPSGTTAYEKRNISELVAVWDSELVHPVRQLQLRLPAQRDPLALLRPGASWTARRSRSRRRR